MVELLVGFFILLIMFGFVVLVVSYPDVVSVLILLIMFLSFMYISGSIAVDAWQQW
jgi:hypothetical protein